VPFANSINASLRTIRYEFLCYLFIPLLHVCGVYRYKYALLLIFALSMTVLYFQDHQGLMLYGWETFPFIGKPDYFPRFLTYFLAGMCFNQYKDSIPRSKSLLIISVIGISLGFFVFKGVNLVLPLMGTYMLFYVAFTEIFTLKNFGKYGDFSYGLYVYAWPVQQLIMLHLSQYLNINLFFILSVLITFPLAWLSWKYVEKPFLNKKARAIINVRKLKSELV
ncbi:MAG TPA: hypothetical protein VL947_08025, partial [Cytophagales bacterium]|nr:hypothetical protein [Cytophagales bacterium]